jgi:hypothetical protein
MLPQKLPWELAQTQWATQINPVLANPLSGAIILKNVQLSSGANVINHRLGRALQGWYPVRVRASATFYDTQDTNNYPELTLNLTASAKVTIDLVVF